MNFYGIICEFNPFHEGHKYLIEKTRSQTRADAIVCVMSGSMVQRGDIAVFDKWTRAEDAVKNGADLVIELPVCCVLQSADKFAMGAVSLLNSLGASGIAFGSECDDISLLQRAAVISLSEPTEYKEAFSSVIRSGGGYPAACGAGLAACIGDVPEIVMPNSTLGISYIKSAMILKSSMDFLAVERIGDYHSTELDVPYPSASAIRQNLIFGDKSAARLYENRDVYNVNAIAPLILGFLRLADPESLNGISGMEPGLANRMINAAKEAGNIEDFVCACVSKRYTAHRIRRAALCALLGITESPTPRYARVLAMNKTGAAVLKYVKDKTALEIVIKASKYKFSGDKMFTKDVAATDIAALCIGKKSGADFTKSPILL